MALDRAVPAAPKEAPAPPKDRPVPPPAQRDLAYFMNEMRKRVESYHGQNASVKASGKIDAYRRPAQADRIMEAASPYMAGSGRKEERSAKPEALEEEKPRQMDLFEERLLHEESRKEHKIIGQVFDTYWLVEYHNNLYIIDQHAAHERVLYEKTLAGMRTREFTSQMISPPIVLTLTMKEAALLQAYMDQFTRIGFTFEEFGQDSYAVRAVPDNLFGIAKKELLLEMLDSLSDEISRNMPERLIDEKIASMSCKAAVKGNMRMSAAETDALIGELLKPVSLSSRAADDHRHVQAGVGKEIQKDRVDKMKDPLIILTGPTASGKTSLSIALAKAVGGEIISADSMQVYKYMDIGSAKVRPEEMGGIPHYLVDMLEPDEEFHVVRFQEMAKSAMKRIRDNGHIPIVVGGTGFYIQALLYDIDFTADDGDTGVRKELASYERGHGAAALHRRLRSTQTM